MIHHTGLGNPSQTRKFAFACTQLLLCLSSSVGLKPEPQNYLENLLKISGPHSERF